MRCGACMAVVERTLTGLKGVSDARVNLSARRANVTYDESLIDTQPLIDALARPG
jgi:copper chaperone CopZ